MLYFSFIFDVLLEVIQKLFICLLSRSSGFYVIYKNTESKKQYRSIEQYRGRSRTMTPATS